MLKIITLFNQKIGSRFSYYLYIIMNYIYITLVLSALVGGIYYNYKKALHYKAMYEVAQGNVKAYELNDKNKAILYQVSLQELKNSNDSLTRELLNVAKQHNIKKKNINHLSYQTSTITKHDTIVFKDTIFNHNIAIDTTLQDKWYKMTLSLNYPNSIRINPSFQSERYIIAYSKRETIKPPSKLFFIRWFQKKHTIVYVEVEEKNPYITIDKHKYIKILK